MQSRTLYAVLGMLQEGPRSGYDLKQEFEEKVRHFWAESVGQIYPALKRARSLGWVRSRSAPRDGRRRTEHVITARGRAALEEWFREEPAPPPVRHELLLKVFFGARLDREALAGHVRRYEERLREERRHFGGFEAEIERRASSPEEEALWKLTLASGKHVNRARLAWCREAHEVLASLAQGVEASG